MLGDWFYFYFFEKVSNSQPIYVTALENYDNLTPVTDTQQSAGYGFWTLLMLSI